MSLFLLGILSFSPDRKPWAYLFAALLIIHGLLSLGLAVKKYLRPHRIYPLLNRTFILQITLGIIVLVLLGLHMISFGYITHSGEYVLRELHITTYLLQLGIIIAVGLHCFISLPKAGITLGLITKQNRIRPAKIAAALIALPPMILAIIAFTGYYLPAFAGIIW